MRMQKKKFRIGELAKKLAVEKFVIRFWEKEFNLSSDRSQGGQRFYDNDDVERFEQIKKLLYDKGFTIAGAKQQLARKTTFDDKCSCSKVIEKQRKQLDTVYEQLRVLKKHLLNLQSSH